MGGDGRGGSDGSVGSGIDGMRCAAGFCFCSGSSEGNSVIDGRSGGGVVVMGSGG